jgi:hypothetical protein
MTDDPTTTAEDLRLPELTQACLDADTLDALFADLAACTQVLEVVAKPARTQMIPNQRLTLDDARELITRRTVRGVQIRYRYDGAEWWDTLMAGPDGVRVVRIRHG